MPRFKKNLQRLGQAILIILFFDLVGIAALLAWFVLTPEIHIDQTQFNWLKKHFLPANLVVEWSQADLRMIKVDNWHKDVRLVLGDFCLTDTPKETTKEAVHACFSELHFGFDLEFKRPWISRYHPLVVRRLQVNINADAFAPTDPYQHSQFSISDFLREQFLPRWDYPGSQIEMVRAEYKTGARRYQAALDLTTGKLNEIDLTLREFKDLAIGFPTAQGQLHVSRLASKSLTDLVAKLLVKTAPKQKIGLQLTSQISDWQNFDYQLKSNFHGLSSLHEIQLHGQYHLPETGGVLSLRMGDQKEKLQTLNFLKCHYALDLRAKSGGLACPPQQVIIALKEYQGLGRPQFFKLHPEFDLRLTEFQFARGFSFNWDFQLGLKHLGFLNLATQAHGQVNSPPKGSLHYAVDGRLKIQVTGFQKLVQWLKGSPYAVPAPFNNLDGPLTGRLVMQMNENGGRIPFVISPRLKSKQQKVFADFSGDFNLVKRPQGFWKNLVSNANLDDILLALPRAELRSPPQLSSDARFHPRNTPRKLAQMKNIPSTFFYEIGVRTLRSGALQLQTNLSKSPIPISLDYHIAKRESLPKSSQPRGEFQGSRSATTQAAVNNGSAKAPATLNYGVVTVGHTDLELFNRNAWIDSLQVNLTPKGEKDLHGTIHVKYVDYEVTVTVAGTTEKPIVQMESDPPLPQDQILGVLLFGRPLSDLEASQKSSVSQLNAAVTDAVLGLSSLYFLASTPVESIGYDPDTQLVTAKVGIGGGTSIELGGGENKLAAVGLRKRLARDWVLKSYVEQSGQTEQKTVTAYVEWARRF